MSAASRSRRTIPTRSTWRRPATSSRTTSPISSAAPIPARAGSRSTAIFPRARSPAWCAPIRCAKGLLFVGTETGVFFSLDDGQSWARLPAACRWFPVYDLKIKGSDLVAGTHGRSFWILDDISPLRALADGGHRDAPRPAAHRRSAPAALRRAAARPARHLLRARLRHRRRHRHGRAAGRHAKIREYPRRRREPAERRHRLLLAGRGRRRARSRSPSATPAAQDRDPLAATTRLAGAAKPRRERRPQPLCLGHASIPARPGSTMGWRHRGPSRWRPTLESRRALTVVPGTYGVDLAVGGKTGRELHPGQGPALARRPKPMPPSSPCTWN